MTRRRVDLPHPLTPTMETNSPASMVRSTSAIAWNPLSNVLLIPRSWMAGCGRAPGAAAIPLDVFWVKVIMRSVWWAVAATVRR